MMLKRINLNISPNVQRSFHRSLLILRKYSPEILLGTGIAGMIGSTVLACKATLKFKETQEVTQDVLDYITSNKKDIDSYDPSAYPDEDFKRDITTAKIQGAINIIQLYTPAAALGAISIGSIVGGHYILSKRNVALIAAFKMLDEAFKKYRERVVENLGPEEDQFFRFGVPEKKFDETKDGKKIIKNAPENEDPLCMVMGDESVYARYFNENNPQWRKDHTANIFFLRGQQNYANDMLKTRGHIFLNEVYDSLGFPRTDAGAVVGWIYNGDGDNFVDFDIYNKVNEANPAFRSEHTTPIFLDFNVDGVIFDKI